MYLGKLCEVAPSERLYADPAHPYTKVLIDAIPVPDPTVRPPPPVTGDPPSAVFPRDAPPVGCRFAPRCARATAICAEASRSSPVDGRRLSTSSPATIR